MGRTSKKKSKDKAKNKAKKDAKRRETEMIAARTALVNAVNEKTDLMADLAAFAAFALKAPAKSEVALTYARADDLSEDEHAAVFDLLERNMKAMYIQAGPGWGWNPKDKKRELQDEAARFLLLKDASSGALVGFAHVRFIMEGVEPVAYLYELQLEDSARRQGLGQHALRVVELMARKNSMRWVMCTVFKCNEASMAFFERQRYAVDETSPSMSVFEEEATYEIMSKALCKDAAEQGEKACAQLKADIEAQNARAEDLEEKLRKLGMYVNKMDEKAAREKKAPPTSENVPANAP
jgi:GNAT superfamily N-acetyltransferase